MNNYRLLKTLPALALAAGLAPTAFADSIDPAEYAASLDVGESVTIRKTVTVDDAPSARLLDVMFLIDTSGSMGGPISAAKTAAGDILTGLAGFGGLSSGFGYYSEPGSTGVFQDLTTDDSVTQAGIDSWVIGFDGGGFGGDFPEEGLNATKEAAEGASWRTGSSRVIIALGDATFKESDGTTIASTLAALDDENVTFIGIDFGCMTCGGVLGSNYDPTGLADATGGSIVDSTTDPDDLVAAILAGVGGTFDEYDTVSITDFGAGLPGVGVSVECVDAADGICDGDSAIGEFDRETTREFEFDVTFTGLEEGVHEFETCATVDGAIAACEDDTITVGRDVPPPPTPVPEPGTIALLMAGLIGLGSSRRFMQ